MESPKIYHSTYPAPYCATNISLSQFLTDYNPDAVTRDKVILEDDWSGRSLTYGSLRSKAAEHAWSLRERYGLKAGDMVAISAPNSVDHILLIHSVLWTGATIALMNFLSTEADFFHYFTICKPKLVAIDPSLHDMTVRALKRVPSLGRVDIISLGGPHPDLVNYPSAFENKRRLPIFDLSLGDNRNHTAAICFSSGTSGNPKGVELSHYNLIASLGGIRSTDPAFYNSESRCVFFAPLCHIYGLNTVGLMGIWLGAYTMLMKKYDLNELLKLSTSCKANTLRIVPSIALAMTKALTLNTHDLSSIKFIMCSGASLQQDVIKSLQKKFNQAPIFQGYGMTETNIATLRSHEWDRVGSVGRLFANIEARIVDDNLKDVEEGQDGEMLVRGPTVFRRYLNNPAATSETFHNGWMRTGDVLHFDSEGFLYLTDRKKELIKYKGFQVAPSELEGILTSHPLVDEGVVCATWDHNEGTEIPMAYVTLSNVVPADPGARQKAIVEIQQFVNGKVSPYKKLRGGVEILQEIPKTASGKILRRLLPARLARGQQAKL
ncbi:acyl-CoA synthetases/AMP-acid ligases II [Melanomma pulvis-pyrius CBS 109.77]|uniref:Acyl-CoA synthetases/AMP-acid ligases II n=1 Tax=Melanomma pulvis-pyrius CBS 109.77 TaxID=1314802 RepID=A0A6A6XDI4_9PLEO|nr:acyl-CoA synthetases/AMP-acid ligases II [Melanomma pulvis-pyrius CBS 109.77]